jgi:hypothetical protein
MIDLGTINCPACGAPGVPLVERGRLIVARHACLGLPERDVYEENPPEQVESAPVGWQAHVYTGLSPNLNAADVAAEETKP